MTRRRCVDRKRKSNNRAQKPDYLILTEDSKSAPNYIKGLIRYFDHNLRRFEIRSPGSSPKSIQQEAKRQLENYDQIFCVFDRDRHDDKGNTYSKLKEWISTEDKVVCINSVPCFEYWLLLHYKYSDAPLQNADPTCTVLKKHCPDYDKGALPFKDFKDKVETARQNANASVARYEKDGNEDPMTRMGEFIDILKDLPKK